MKKFMVFLKWLLMWTCDVIPWVSGWTIAFITWIYDELIDSLYAFNLKTLKLLLQWKIKKVWKEINGNFLLSVFTGIFVAIFTLAKLIHYLLHTYPSFVWAFFFGLILASAIILRKSIKKFKIIYLLFLMVGTLVWYYLTSLPVFNLGSGSLTMFASWAIAIIAMILPGISGSYILLILWQYQEVLWNVVAIVEWNLNAIIPILIFIGWAVIGLISFAKLLHWIKSRWHDQMVIVLIWFILWSLNKIWPWKETVSTFLDRHGEMQPLIQKNILPLWSNDVLFAILISLFWFLIVLLIDRLARR